VMPAETEEHHRSALQYAKDRLEEGWDGTAHGKKAVTVTMELCDGEMPQEADAQQVILQIWISCNL